jgi:DNA/RNA endonuclease G (NUC1)
MKKITFLFILVVLTTTSLFGQLRDSIWWSTPYMNCALQHQSLNRGVWKYLEIRERELANQWPIVDITIRIVFDEKPTRVEGGASIPKGFYKVIKYGNVVESYYFPNEMPTSSDYKTYRVK